MSRTRIHVHKVGTYEHIGPGSSEEVVKELKRDPSLDNATKEFIERGIRKIKRLRSSR